MCFLINEGWEIYSCKSWMGNFWLNWTELSFQVTAFCILSTLQIQYRREYCNVYNDMGPLGDLKAGINISWQTTILENAHSSSAQWYYIQEEHLVNKEKEV